MKEIQLVKLIRQRYKELGASSDELNKLEQAIQDSFMNLAMNDIFNPSE